MLTEERHQRILQLIEEKGSIQIAELTDYFGISESTARRDLAQLDRQGFLAKVFGGAVSIQNSVTAFEPTMAQKQLLHMEEKRIIARAAAELIKNDEFLFLDAGTTTLAMIPHMKFPGLKVVTNGMEHAKMMARLGIRVLLLGGELKTTTEAIVGSDAVQMLMNYHFTKGFFGTNGIHKTAGFTTPDPGEAILKKTAMRQCAEPIVLADSSKFGQVSSVTFGYLEGSRIFADDVPDEYRQYDSITVVS